jgi:GT2 family glycosyltransferase
VHPLPAFDVVVCARNNRMVLGETLSGVAGLAGERQSCVVVDGCSTDGSAEFVRANFDWVEVVAKTADNGPGASRNIGAARGCAPYILFLDSDVTLSPDWAAKQIAFLEERPGCAALAGKLVYADDPGRLNAAWGAMNRYGVAWGVGDGESSDARSEPRRCLWNPTAALMVRRSAIEDIGGFDELMFAFHEDSDFGWRANLFGFEVAYNPGAVAWHRAHSTMNRNTMGDHRAFLAYRNRLRSILINYEPLQLARYLPVHLALFLLQTVQRGPRSARLRSLWWNVAVLSDTLGRRRFVQSRRRVRDRDLWFLFEAGFRGPGYE